MRIFLIAGKAGSGKNEVAKIIKEYYIYKLQSCAITSYSKYIKNFALELTDWDGSEGNKPRDFMQQIGDKARDYDPNFFVSNMVKDIAVYKNFVDNLVISDVRMPNEIDGIKDNFDEAVAICVINQFSQSKLTVEQQAHITERALENYEDFDYIIANDSLDKLKEEIFKYLEELK